jgi:hypothetical protein
VDEAYAADALGGRVSESGRLGYIAQCVDAAMPVVMAMCQADIDALDAKKLFGELHATGHTGVERMAVRFAYDQVVQQLPKRQEAVKKLLASDPAYKQMFDIAKQQRTEWDSRWKANAEPLQMAAAMDDAYVTGSRKLSSGCQDKAWHALAVAIPSVPAKRFITPRKDDIDTEYARAVKYNAANALLAEPESYLASAALATCYLLEKPKDIAKEPNADVPSVLISELDYWSGMRGPRTSTATRILQAGLQFDDRAAKVEVPKFRRYWDTELDTMHGAFLGTVTAAKPKGDKINLVFQTKAVKTYQSYGCKNTNHVNGIKSNGEFSYEYTCAGAREVIEHEGPTPDDFTKNFAAVAKPGTVIVAVGDTVFVVWPNAKAPAPTFVLGQPVK